MKSNAHQSARQMADTINHLMGMIDECVSEIAAADSEDEACEALLNAIGVIDDRVSKLRQQLKASLALIQQTQAA